MKFWSSLFLACTAVSTSKVLLLLRFLFFLFSSHLNRLRQQFSDNNLSLLIPTTKHYLFSNQNLRALTLESLNLNFTDLLNTMPSIEFILGKIQVAILLREAEQHQMPPLRRLQFVKYLWLVSFWHQDTAHQHTLLSFFWGCATKKDWNSPIDYRSTCRHTGTFVLFWWCCTRSEPETVSIASRYIQSQSTMFELLQ